jgi:hypothetical protein
VATFVIKGSGRCKLEDSQEGIVLHNNTIFGIAPCILATAMLAFGKTASPDAKGPPPKYDPASVARGKETFVGACGFCHGSNAKGGEKGPDLLRSVIVLDDEHGKAIGPVILRTAAPTRACLASLIHPNNPRYFELSPRGHQQVK